MTLNDSATRSILDPHYVYRVPGMLWPSEISWMFENFSRSDLHLEIGSYCGKSLVAAARGMKAGSTIISVDPLSKHDGWVRDVYEATCKFIEKEMGVAVVHWDMTSVEAMFEAAKQHYEGKFDSIFIDGNHNLAEVKMDIEGWLPFLEPDGILAGHDYWPANKGVMTAVQESFEGNFTHVPNTRIWLK